MLILASLFTLTGCGGSGGAAVSGTGGTTPGGTTPGTPATYTIGGTISGLLTGAGLVLQNNAANDLTVAPGSLAFTFPVAQADASAYSVTIKTQPVGKTCAIAGGSGTVAAANVTGITLVCVSNGQKFAFVANSLGNSVSAYSLDTTTGAASSVGTVSTGGLSNPASLAVTPSGRVLYVANNGGAGSVSAFSFNPVTNALSVVTGSPFAAGTSPFAVAVAPDQVSLSVGKFVYVANSGTNNVSAYSVNAATGALTALLGATGNPFPAGTFPRGIAIDALGKFAYVVNFNSANVSAYTINATTGALTAIAGSPFAAGVQPQSVVVDPASKFVYVANAGGNTISCYTIDAGGVMTPNGAAVAAPAGPTSISMDPTGKVLYVATTTGILGYTIDVAGILTPVVGNPFMATSSFGAVSVNATGAYLYATDSTNSTVTAFAIVDTTTGVLTPLAGAQPATGLLPLAITTTQ